MGQGGHDDVLNGEIPREGEKRQRLLEELKSRAKGAFIAKDLHNADLLYSRAIEVADRKDHLLFSNRAAVRILTRKNTEAYKDADSCLKLEPAFIKAHFRKAQALQRLSKFQEAIDACTAGLDHHSGNAELLKLQKEIESDWQKDKEEKERFNKEVHEKKDLPIPQPTRMAVTKESSSDEKADSPAKKSKTTEQEMRGYKVRADGKVTSYFHTDITEEAKALIGDCKPQKIETPREDSSNNTTAGSQWNQAGTFESVSRTAWFTEKLKSELQGKIDLPNGLPSIGYKVKEVIGDASINSARGKIKYVQDMGVTLKWTLNGDEKGEGTIKFENDGDNDYDIITEVTETTPNSLRTVIQNFIKSSSNGLQPVVMGKLREIEKEFKALKMC